MDVLKQIFLKQIYETNLKVSISCKPLILPGCPDRVYLSLTSNKQVKTVYSPNLTVSALRVTFNRASYPPKTGAINLFFNVYCTGVSNLCKMHLPVKSFGIGACRSFGMFRCKGRNPHFATKPQRIHYTTKRVMGEADHFFSSCTTMLLHVWMATATGYFIVTQ